MKQDAFSGLHPAVNFIYFAVVMVFGMVIQHPVFLAAGLLGAICYYLLLRGIRGLKFLLALVPLLLGVAAVNPLFNREGETVLFYIFGSPYTFESLVYGMVLSAVLLNMVLWFQCFGAVMTGDKFTSLFGNLIPALSLLLVMILRMVPGLIRKGQQITQARKSLGKGFSGNTKDNIREAGAILGCLTTWALEGGIVTADSMRSRGYGTAKRTGFMIYRMHARDCCLLGLTLILTAAVSVVMSTGGTTAAFTPRWHIAPVHPSGLIAYGALTLIPTLFHLQEALSWHISRSGI